MEPPVSTEAVEQAWALEGLNLEDRWRHDSDTGLWRCGDVAIALRDHDKTRYFVFKPAAVGDDRQVLFGGHVPPSGYSLDELRWFGFVLTNDGNGPVPTDGLQPWLDQAQLIADEVYEEMVELDRLRREALEASRVGRTAAALRSEVPAELDELVPGLLIRGWAHKFAGREKQAGKGTLVCYLIGRLERGEPTVFGPAPQAASAVILTEEPEESIREKLEAFDLRRSRIIYGWELAALPWHEKVQRVVAEALADGHELVYFDNFSRSASIEDESGVELGRAVELLQDACRRARLTLIVDHHHKKGRAVVEDKSRGGTALAGAVDVNVEIERVGGRDSRKRRLTAYGRVRAVNWQREIELAEDGADYVSVATGEPVSAEMQQQWVDTQTLRTHGPLTAERFRQLIGRSQGVARRRLNDLVTEGLATCEPGAMTANGRTASLYEAKPSVVAEPSETTDATDGFEGVFDS